MRPLPLPWAAVGGFTIPLDKRLAADGRGLQEQTINNNFATLSESLYIAERKAREELEARSKLTQKLKAKEKDQKEAELREIAAQARMQRAGMVDPQQTAPPVQQQHGAAAMPRDTRDMTEARRDNRPAWMVERDKAAAAAGGDGSEDGGGGYRDEGPRSFSGGGSGRSDERSGGGGGGGGSGGDDESAAMAQRERLRQDRRKEREREMRLENMKGEMKRSKHERERERDVSEKIALGLATGAAKLQGDERFDARLFNQSGGMSSGFGQEDE